MEEEREKQIEGKQIEGKIIEGKIIEERLYRLTRVCAAELEAALDVTLPKRVCYRVNTRAKRRLGLCKRTSSGYEIEVSAALLRGSDEKKIKETVLHEQLHTLPDCMNHKERWKSYADALNARYGYAIERTSSVEAGEEPSPPRPPRYRVVCAQCGASFYRAYRSRTVTNPSRYRCARCGGPLTVETLPSPPQPGEPQSGDPQSGGAARK